MGKKKIQMIRILAITLLLSLYACFNPVSTKSNAEYNFTTANITFQSDTFNLVGSIDIPQYTGTKPAVVIIPGSGAIDRDGSVLEKPIYKIWSNYFAKHGFISLRFDKRFISSCLKIFYS